MYPVAHVVVACGSAWSIERLAWRLFPQKGWAMPEADSASSRPALFDYRFVALGALLPDIIDKPLAWYILGDRVDDNHLVAHTMLFGMLLALPGRYLATKGNPVLISLACGVFTHLFCDPVLREPRTLLWPLYGWTFHNTYGTETGCRST